MIINSKALTCAQLTHFPTLYSAYEDVFLLETTDRRRWYTFGPIFIRSHGAWGIHLSTRGEIGEVGNIEAIYGLASTLNIEARPSLSVLTTYHPHLAEELQFKQACRLARRRFGRPPVRASR